jgi:hypothetical protein
MQDEQETPDQPQNPDHMEGDPAPPFEANPEPAPTSSPDNPPQPSPEPAEDNDQEGDDEQEES